MSGVIREVGPLLQVDGYDDPLELWEALARHFIDKRAVELSVVQWPHFFPQTTVGDVHAIAGLFAERLQRARPDALGLPAARARWLAYQPELQRQTGGRLLTEPFPDNPRFWKETRQVAVYLSAAGRLPAKADIVLDAFAGAAGTVPAVEVRAGLDPATASADVVEGPSVASVTREVVDHTGRVVRTVAGAAGDAASSIAGGLKSGVGGVTDAVVTPIVGVVGKPLLIGAAVAGGLLIVPKLLDRRARRAS